MGLLFRFHTIRNSRESKYRFFLLNICSLVTVSATSSIYRALSNSIDSNQEICSSGKNWLEMQSKKSWLKRWGSRDRLLRTGHKAIQMLPPIKWGVRGELRLVDPALFLFRIYSFFQKRSYTIFFRRHGNKRKTKKRIFLFRGNFATRARA